MDRTSYPVQFSVDYPDRQLNRLTSSSASSSPSPSSSCWARGRTWSELGKGTGAAPARWPAVLRSLLMILFRQKYPRWWFDWNLELQRFSNRVGVYLALMDDRYPSTDDHQSVHLDYAYPDASAT